MLGVTENMVVIEVIDVVDTLLYAPPVWNHAIVFSSCRIVGAAWLHPKGVIAAMHSCRFPMCVVTR